MGPLKQRCPEPFPRRQSAQKFCILKVSIGLSKLLFISYLIKGSMKASKVIVGLCQWQLNQLDHGECENICVPGEMLIIIVGSILIVFYYIRAIEGNSP